ncbi:MAG: hypothetical protein JNM17_40530 [Archangium sp.]|nr:hypothetical protein [Archangium sp.]
MSSFVVLAVLSAAGVQEGIRYGSGNNPLDAVVKLADAQLVQQIVGLAPMQKVTKIDRLGKAATLWKEGDKAVSGDASREERIAILSVLQRQGALGSETDLLIAKADGQKVPITVLVELGGAMTLASGAPVKELISAGPTAEEIATKYKLDAFTADGTTWTPIELAAVDKALSMLTPDEVALLGGLGFRRKANDVGGRSAFYRRADDGMTIDIFDKTFKFDGEYFVGSIDAPVLFSVGIMLHEMAHAMSDFQGRQKAIVANKAVAEARAAQDAMKASPSPETKAAAKEKTEAARALRGAINALDKVMLAKGRAAEKSYAAVVDAKTSVSVYGRTSIDENLAESFLLSKLDKPALERIAPQALPWFAAGTLAKEAQKPLE